MARTSLPPIEEFYDPLNKVSLTDLDYQRAQAAWFSMECQNFGEYMLNYLKMDVYPLPRIQTVS